MKLGVLLIGGVWDAAHSALTDESPLKALEILEDRLLLVNLKNAYMRRINGPGSSPALYKPYFTTGPQGASPLARSRSGPRKATVQRSDLPMRRILMLISLKICCMLSLFLNHDRNSYAVSRILLEFFLAAYKISCTEKIHTLSVDYCLSFSQQRTTCTLLENSKSLFEEQRMNLAAQSRDSTHFLT